MQQSDALSVQNGAAAPAIANQMSPIEFSQQWESMQRKDGYRGKVDMQLPRLGVTTAKFNYPAGRYDVESSEHWGVGIVKRPFDVAYCASGTGSCGQRRVFASEVIVSEPNSAFDAKLRSGAEIEYVVISKKRFSRSLPSHLKDLEALPTNQGAFFSSHLLTHLAQALLDQLRHQNASHEIYTDAIIDALVAELLKDVLAETPKNSEVSEVLTDRDYRRLDAYITENLHSKIGINDLSKAVGIPSSQLRSLLKARTGDTPYQLILNARVRQAQLMLKTTRRSAAEIAFDCGFSSQSHMSDIFRQRLGKSPGQVRSS